MDNIKIVKLLPDQWKKYKELRLKALKSDPQAFSSSYERESAYPDEKWQQRLDAVGNGRSWALFAENENSELVGMAGGYRDDNDIQNHSVQIFGVFVEPGMRGKGIAKALMTELLKEMESDPDINKIILEVNPDQESAKRLYHSFNFSDLATYPRLMGDGVEHQITKMERVVMK